MNGTQTTTCTDMASGTELLTPHTFIMEKPPKSKKKDIISKIGSLAITLKIFVEIIEFILTYVN
ncbi:hypothetical protein [Paenimyroides baculatum]|uniref:Uncharacterized protein n=1 Tax=Paenimyroides baculatum TaxID=2608000 RepID=A0A5M6CH60_9FLAO|nr:hypothetical protein [Paenimyroides baculatum]KAA5534326.1 hypothetical protein F0460_09465 [Paenimyroides baculatum]